MSWKRPNYSKQNTDFLKNLFFYFFKQKKGEKSYLEADLLLISSLFYTYYLVFHLYQSLN